MIHVLKAVEGEQVKNTIPWTLTVYDDIYGIINTITEYEYVEGEE